MATLQLLINARKLKAAFVATQGEAAWQAFWRKLVLIGSVDEVRQASEKRASLWATQPICPEHSGYAGNFDYQSLRAAPLWDECAACDLVREAWLSGQPPKGSL